MLTLDRPLAILDLEATSVDPAEARIIQVAILRLEPENNGDIRITDRYDQLVNPMTEIPSRVSDLTGISVDDVADAPPLTQVGHEIHERIHDADLAAYNGLRYDIPLLEAEFQRHFGKSVPGPGDRQIVDMLALEKALVSRSLEAVFERYTGEKLEGAHDALTDARAALEVLDAQIAEHIPGGATPAKLADLARGDYLDDGRKLKERDDGAVEVCFGKHSGKTLQELHDEEPGYFDWMYQTIDELQPHIDSALS